MREEAETPVCIVKKNARNAKINNEDGERRRERGEQEEEEGLKG